MSYGEVEQLYLHFPEAIHLFAVYDKSRIAAAALCVVVNPEVLYAFYYDHHRDYDRVSPVVLLMEFIYRWCAEKNSVTLIWALQPQQRGWLIFHCLRSNCTWEPCHRPSTFFKRS